MAFVDYQLTLTGAAQRLSSVLTDPTVGGAEDVPLRLVVLESKKANTADIFIAGKATVSATIHAVRLDAGDTSANGRIVLGPFDNGGPLHLSDFYVLGTANEVLLIGTVPY